MILLVFPALLVGVYLGLWGAGGALVVADPVGKADAVVVLSGDQNLRMKYAVQLIRQGHASYLIITETGVEFEGQRTSVSDLAKKTAADYGVPEGDIFVTRGASTSTVEEARAVRKLARQEKFQRLLVVTDPFHTLRTRWVFRDHLKDTGITTIVLPAPGHWYRSSTWFFSLAGWRETLSEYAKLFLYLAGQY